MYLFSQAKWVISSVEFFFLLILRRVLSEPIISTSCSAGWLAPLLKFLLLLLSVTENLVWRLHHKNRPCLNNTCIFKDPVDNYDFFNKVQLGFVLYVMLACYIKMCL